MGKIKNFLLDVEELYYSGFTANEISVRLGVSLKMVKDAIHQFNGPTEDYEFYEDDEDGNS